MRTFIRLAAAAAAIAFAPALPLRAAEDNWLAGGELRAAIAGNTITGRYDNGDPYSEYHAPDGRVLGHNNREMNEDACWDIRNDTVCYYYAKGRSQGEFCWRVQRVGERGIRAKLIDRTGREILGVSQRGNPHGHDDNGKPWTCDPLSSERKGPGDALTRFARR